MTFSLAIERPDRTAREWLIGRPGPPEVSAPRSRSRSAEDGLVPGEDRPVRSAARFEHEEAPRCHSTSFVRPADVVVAADHGRRCCVDHQSRQARSIGDCRRCRAYTRSGACGEVDANPVPPGLSNRKRSRTDRGTPLIRTPKTLPKILEPDEVTGLFGACRKWWD